MFRYTHIGIQVFKKKIESVNVGVHLQEKRIEYRKK